jgi:hypothetical protein
MRGAGLRLDNDVRRVWRCAACGAERKVGAQVTTVRCQCAGRPAMKLVEAMRRERPLKEPTSPYLEFVFEPGELAPPRSGNGNSSDPEVAAAIDREISEGGPVPPDGNSVRQPENTNPSDSEASAEIDREVNEGSPVPPESEIQRSTRPPRSPQRDDRRGDRGPAPGQQGRRDQGQRRDQPPQQRDQPPRQNQRGPDKRQPDRPDGNAPAGQNAPRRDKPPRRQDTPRDQPSAAPPPTPHSDGFGEGIPEIGSPKP